MKKLFTLLIGIVFVFVLSGCTGLSTTDELTIVMGNSNASREYIMKSQSLTYEKQIELMNLECEFKHKVYENDPPQWVSVHEINDSMYVTTPKYLFDTLYIAGYTHIFNKYDSLYLILLNDFNTDERVERYRQYKFTGK